MKIYRALINNNSLIISLRCCKIRKSMWNFDLHPRLNLIIDDIIKTVGKINTLYSMPGYVWIDIII